MEGESAAKQDWKWGVFQGQVESWYKKNSQESARIIPAKTLSNRPSPEQKQKRSDLRVERMWEMRMGREEEGETTVRM